ncbi:MAG: GNAT family N-acetyltransferase [Bacteroidales bacterium]|nr:GNAT family N-acetyltransferase [Bacteroidales bacterium]MBO7529191.1 GNAT family N-acetyltransferase [Bacteroidales bacterium]
MEQIIAPIPVEVLKSELTPERMLRTTNKSKNEIYIITAHNAPNVMKEIGRLREIAFRDAGGGTGKEADIDEFDTCEKCYEQLVVWNPDEEEILGGYRFLRGTDWKMGDDGQPKIATGHMFHFSDKFLNEYKDSTIELGRSFVSLPYQSSRMGAKSLFALDNLWDGLGALTVVWPDIKYFFGKMTMYPSYVRKGRDMLLYFLNKHFPDKENLVTPINPVKIETDLDELAAILCEDKLNSDYRILNREIRRLGTKIPPLVNSYMGLSQTMRVFGTAVNEGFGNVEETGILIAIDEIEKSKVIRHISSFIRERYGFFLSLRKNKA